MTCGIYKITNKINQHSYIGQAINIENRWRKEKTRAFTPTSNEYNKTLSRAFRKYGINNFSFEIIEECKIEDLDDKEKYYISFYDTYFNGYNETTGGKNGTGNHCQKISKEDLINIYDLLLNTSIPQKEIAKKFSVGEDVISTINNGKSRRLEGYTYPLRNYSRKRYCCDCGVELKSYNSIRCVVCEKKRLRVVERPSREELKKLIRNIPFTTLGKKYNVSDKAISKWCIYYNLPSRKKDIKKYSDEEWELI